MARNPSSHQVRCWWPLALMSVAPTLGGCVFDQLQRSNENDIQRVEHKQAALQAEQDRSAQLTQQENELVSELGEREFSLSEINDRVEKLQAANGHNIALNDAKRGEYEEMIARLHDTNQQLASLRRDTDGPIAQRRERISYLKAQIQAQLQLLLH